MEYRLNLKELSKIRTEKHPLITFYFTASSPFEWKEEANIFLKSMASKQEERLSKELLDGFRSDVEKIKDYINYKLGKSVRSLVFFTCENENLFKFYKAPFPITTLFFVGNTPYLKPLAGALDNYGKYILAIMHIDYSSIYIIDRTVIVEGISKEDKIPVKTRKAGWKNLAKPRVERRRGEYIKKHYKDIANIVRNSMDKDISRIIIAGTKKNVNMFINYLPNHLKDIVSATFQFDTHYNDFKIIEKSLEVELESERRADKRLIEQLKQLGREKIAVGLYQVLLTLQRGQIDKLIIHHKFQEPGWFCNNCGYLASGGSKICPMCKVEMSRVKDIVDEVVNKAIEFDIDVDFVSENGFIDNFGGMAAILRY